MPSITLVGIAAVASAAVSAYGAIQQGQAQANAANYQSQVQQNNAKIASQQANYASAAGQEQATVEGLKASSAGGRIRASQAANNVDVNSGSAVKVQTSQREAGSLNEQQAVNTAQQQVYGYRAAAVGDQAQSGLSAMEADQATTGADLSAAGGLLGSASSLGFKYGSWGSNSNGTSWSDVSNSGGLGS